MNTDHNFSRLLIILLITVVVCFGLYYLPDTIFGFSIKKIDLLTDIRTDEDPQFLDSLRTRLAQDTSGINQMASNDSLRTATADTAAVPLRDSLYKAILGIQEADPSGKRFEDYSAGHTGLKRFFEALNKSRQMERPVRIAFLGDSFIEGDILVADFREAMQQRFGGAGVGFVPINSVSDKFRPTINLEAKGWTTHSLLHDGDYSYVLPCMLFEAKSDQATFSFKMVDRYSSLKRVASLKFIYEYNKNASLQLVCNHKSDTLNEILPPSSDAINQIVINKEITDGYITFAQAKGLRAVGIALEDNSGIIVDNYSMRGSSGTPLGRLDMESCKVFSKIRPYDLIILQYGLNVVSKNTFNYDWYYQGMVEAVRHIKKCFPDSDVLIIGVSDRATQKDGKFQTMPEVLAFLHTQRQIARQAGVPFWNLFGAMGGEDSIVHYVENNWASKDFTHMNFNGGKEIAKALIEAFISEKEFYDKAEKTVY